MEKQKLINAAKDLNKLFELDIDFDNIDEHSVEVIKEEVIEAAIVLQDGDTLKQSTVNILTDLEVDIPAGLKIVNDVKSEKVEVKKHTTKVKSKKVTKQTTTKTNKKIIRSGKINEVKEKLIELLLEEIHSQKYIRKTLIAEFPDVSRKRIYDLLACVKNEKYNKLDKLVIVDDKGIMKFEK